MVINKQRLAALILPGILLLALGLRLALANYGLPLWLYEDEPIYLQRAMHFGLGDFSPHYFKKPSFFLYSYFALYWLLSAVMHGLPNVLNHWQTVVLTSFQQDPSFITLAGRLLSVMFSVLSVWLLYKIARLAFQKHLGHPASRTIALLAAGFLAVDPTHIKASPVVISDIPALFAVLLSTYGALKIYTHEVQARWRDYIVCAVGIALSMSYKYNAFTGVLLLFGHGLRYAGAKQGWQAMLQCKKLWVSLMLVPVLFIGLNPYVALDFNTFWHDLNHERRHMLTRTITETQRHWQWMIGADNILLQILPKAMGWPLYVFSLLGLLQVLGQIKIRQIKARQHWQHAVWLAFPVGFFLAVAQFRLINAKYMLPVLPFLYLCAAVFYLALWQRSQAVSPKPLRLACQLGVLVLLGIALSIPVKQTAAYEALMQQPDTRVLAQASLKQMIPANKTMQTQEETLQITNAGGVRPDYMLLRLRPQKNKAGKPSLPYFEQNQSRLSQYRALAVWSPFNTPSQLVLKPEQAPTAPEDYLRLYQGLKQDRRPVRPGPMLILLALKPSE